MCKILLQILFLISIAGYVYSANTKTWKVSSVRDFLKGTLEQVMISSLGELCLGPEVEKIETEEISVWSSVIDSNGTIYLGTGNNGKIYQVKKNKLETIYSGESIVVTCLAIDKNNILYAGCIPGGQILKQDLAGKVTSWVVLPENYIWTITVDLKGYVYAGTGPEGKVYRISPEGKFTVVVDLKEEHVLSMVLDKQNNIYCGTSMNGLLVKIKKDGKYEVMADLDENEIRTICISGENLYLGANRARKFEPARFVRKLKLAAKRAKKGEEVESPLKNLFDGSVYRVSLVGNVQKIFSLERSYVSDLKVTDNEEIIVGSGDEGRVYKIFPSFLQKRLLMFDLNEKQALTIACFKGNLRLIGTGNGGTIYLLKKQVANTGNFLSEVKDAKFFSQWGYLSWDAVTKGKKGGVSLQTRSGNTVTCDDGTWSKWSKKLTRMPAKIKSPPGRYVQFKVNWQKPAAVLRWVMLSYLQENQKPVITDIDTELVEEIGFKGKTKESADIKINYNAHDDDGDELVYYLYAQKDGSMDWIKLNKEPITKKRFTWDTVQVPDGWYRIKLIASDEKMNPEDKKLVDEKVLEPFLVDNSKPAINNFSIKNLSGEGTAFDSFSVIARIEYSLDGDGWEMIYPEDGIYDETQEKFKISLKHLSKGRHRLNIRTYDAAGNMSTYQQFFDK